MSLDRRMNVIIRTAASVLVAATLTHAQTHDIPWHTIDGGGFTFSTGGSFELGGTIGQHDAGPVAPAMSGGSLTLVGGFWPAAAETCACPGDINGDSQKNGLDVQQFVDCVLSGGGDCSCADLDGAPGVTWFDVSVFVDALLAGVACP